MNESTAFRNEAESLLWRNKIKAVYEDDVMLSQLIEHLSIETGVANPTARRALGIILNAADRQGAPLAEALFQSMAGARTLSAEMGGEIGTANGVIARLIEQTPGGRRHVAESMISHLHAEGFDHAAIGKLMPALAGFLETKYGLDDFGHLGTLFGSPSPAQPEAPSRRTAAA